MESNSFDSEALYGLLIGLITCNDGGLVDNIECFPCTHDSHQFWMQARDEIQSVWSNFEFTQSPIFLESVQSKSDHYQTVARRMAIQKKAEHKAAFDAALRDAITSDQVFGFVPTLERVKLWELINQIRHLVADELT